MSVLNGVRAVLPLLLVLTSGAAVAQDCTAEASLKSKPLAGCDLSFLAQQIEVSPIEQFRLTGLFHFSPRADQVKALNNRTSGEVELVRTNPQMESSQWEFEAVAGTPFVRIKNKSRDVVLKDDRGRLLAAPAQPDGGETHWTLEPVDGLSFVQIRNRDTESFLAVVDGVPVLVDDPRRKRTAIGRSIRTVRRHRRQYSCRIARTRQRPRIAATLAVTGPARRADLRRQQRPIATAAGRGRLKQANVTGTAAGAARPGSPARPEAARPT